MSPFEAYKDRASYAILETIYRGLFAALMRDPALGKRLVLFLPYYVTYHSDGYSLNLIHPKNIGWAPSNDYKEDTYPDRAATFLRENETIITSAIANGRSKDSILYKRVHDLNEQKKSGAWIDSKYDGRIQYRTLIKESFAATTVEAATEYNVTDSFPDLYPALGVLCQGDGKVIGLVSMDFDDQMCEKIEAAFNSFMEPYSGMELWRELSGETLADYFQKARVEGSWLAKAELHNGFSSDEELQLVLAEITRNFPEAERAKLITVLQSASDWKQKHSFLESLQRPNNFVPALWVALTSGVRNPVPDILSTSHFTIELLLREVDSSEMRKICIAGGKVFGEWSWTDCEFAAPWLLLKGTSDKEGIETAQQLLKPRQPGEGKFTESLWDLAGAFHHARPCSWKRLVEVRILSDPRTQANAALNTLCKETPVGVILGSTEMIVAIRGGWLEP